MLHPGIVILLSISAVVLRTAYGVDNTNELFVNQRPYITDDRSNIASYDYYSDESLAQYFTTTDRSIEEPNLSERYDVIIVGAGTAGLAAAQSLLENGYSNILVLEARNRIGGRIHTIRYGGEKVDLGAQYVYAYTGNKLFEMTKNLSRYFDAPSRESDLMSWSGKQLQKPILNEIMALQFNMPFWDNSTFAQWFIPKAKAYLSSKGVPTEDRRLYLDAARKLFSVHNGADMTNTSAWGITNYRESSYGRSKMWQNGFIDFISVLLGELGNRKNLGLRDKILLEKEVVGIEYRGDSFLVNCNDYTKYNGKHVILTLPLGVLKDLPQLFFTEDLPEPHAKAIKYLGVGYTNKIFFDFDEDITQNRKIIFGMDSDMKNRFCSSVYKKGTWPVGLTGLCPTRNEPNLINSWITGDAAVAMESVSDEQLIDGVLAMGRTILGKQLPRPLSVRRSTWASDTYSRGSYSYRSVEAETNKVSHGDLMRPVIYGDNNVLQFAGEATSELHYGTVHGALESGWDAAASVMDSLIHPNLKRKDDYRYNKESLEF